MNTNPSSSNQPERPAGRLLSLDALRGFDMFWIIGGGDVVATLLDLWPAKLSSLRTQLEHVEWEGVHFEDLIYPLFLFIIGVVLPFSLSRRRAQGQSTLKLHLHALQRSALLVVLGSIPGGLLQFDRWPFMGGVLAHIGLCYFFAAPLVMHLDWRKRAWTVAGYLVAYYLASRWIPIPGSGTGIFTEDGSLASWIDHHLISGKLWNEGPASTPSGICIILWGSLAGQWLQSEQTETRKAAGLAALGVASLLLAWLWSFSFPMIKRVVWSSSYVTFACGWSLLLLSAFYWVIDVRGYRRWSFFFVVIGTNAITIYFLQSIVDFEAIAQHFVSGLARYSGFLAPVVFALGAFALKWLLLLLLHRHRIFVRV